MGFIDNTILMLKYCIDNSLVRFGDTPLLRLTDDDFGEPYFVNITEVFGNNTLYSYEKFIEIINSKGLDGFAF